MENKNERFSLRSAVYLLLFKDNKVLLSRRCNTGWMDGHYSLIAGHLDGNETVSEAMIREAFEEGKIKIKKEDLIPAVVIHRKANVEYIVFSLWLRNGKANQLLTSQLNVTTSNGSH